MNKNYIISEISNAMGDDFKIEFRDIVKNNGVVHHSICGTKNGSYVGMTVYYDEKDADSEIVKKVVSALKSNLNTANSLTSSVDRFADWDWVKDKIIPVLFNRDRNDYKDLLTLEFVSDIGICFRVIVTKGDNETGTVKVTNEMVNTWGVSVSTILDTAKANMDKIVVIQSLFDILMGSAKKERSIEFDDMPMHVINNVTATNGAAAILLIPDFVKSGEINNKDYIIIPSSIHECILLDKDHMGIDEINGMIQSVNAECVNPEEFLSDYALIYNARTRQIEKYER